VGTSGNAGRSGKGRLLLVAATVAGVVALDQAVKLWATKALAGQPPVAVIENFFHLVYHRNTGGVFGLFAGPVTSGRRFIFIGVTAIALLFIGYLMREWGRESLAALVGLSLVAGGAVGNLIDRAAYGEVIDFIDWHWHSHHWPAFNIADSAITAGTTILILSMLLAPRTNDDDSRQGP
jgi:signal peptidase II